jgi:hypothetical protein
VTAAVDAGPSLAASAAGLVHLNALQDVAVGRDVAGLFAAHGTDKDFPKTAHALLPVIIGNHANTSAQITAAWYDAQDPGSKFTATPYPEIAPEQIAKSIDWALYAPGEQPPIERMTGDSQRIVRNSGRRTMTRNAAAEGMRWARLAEPGACSYCRVLAMRGSGRADQKYLYYSDKSAMFRKSDGESYHTHCKCEAVAVRGGKVWTPPDYTADWDSEFKGAAKATPLKTPDDPKGKKYFQRVAALMRANEPPTPEEAAKAAEKQAADEQAKIDAAEAKLQATIKAAHDALITDLDAAKDYKEVEAVAKKLLRDTDIDFGGNLNVNTYLPPTVPDTQLAVDVVKAVDDVLNAYPGMKLEGLLFNPLPDSTYAQEAYSPSRQVRIITMNRHWTDLPGLLVNAWNGNVADRFHHSGTVSPAYNVIVHEMGHAMQDLGTEAGVTLDDLTVMTALADQFKASNPMTGISTQAQELAFRAWLLDGLSGYSRQDPSGNSIALNVDEALAEAFADTFINGDDAKEPSKVMTNLLTDALDGVSYWKVRNAPNP